ncbi:ABC transporter permease [Oryzibacter oryziterrae]|uniref:ABC transporter permease n=1 Tax=Oryzibacter oryziterrae TaxID=2766474 RepID=UPI001F21D5AF|nr:ABC transporter permease [Oryzibacter oryziterrae]
MRELDGDSLGGAADAGAGVALAAASQRRSGRAWLANLPVQFSLAFLIVLALWQAGVMVLDVPVFMLPPPSDVLIAFRDYGDRLLAEAAITLFETLLGLIAGVALGIATGLAVSLSPLMARLLSPLLVVSQSLPVFALAPLLVLWLGFGLSSKIVMTSLVIYFPVASSFADGLNRTEPGLMDLGRLMKARRFDLLRLIRVPAALPALVTGIRVAAVYAPIGAVIGEWVGASHGLGLLMVQANARMQTALLFAALTVLAVATIALKILVDRLTARLIPWVETT